MTSLFEIAYADTQKLRGKAVKMVNLNRGYVPIKDALRNRMEMQHWDGLDGEEDE